METAGDQDRIDAREALLDAVDALGPHSDAVILVGAQAIYVHAESEETSFALSPFTYDADIVLDPGVSYEVTSEACRCSGACSARAYFR